MSTGLLSRMAPRGLLFAAAASAALIIGGCAQEQQPGGTAMSSPGPQGSAMQASASGESTPQAAPGESRAVMAFPTGNPSSSDLLVEQIGPREVRVGQPYRYQLRVTNLTNNTLSGVVLRQRLPEHFRLADNKQIRHEGDEAHFDIGDLGPKQTKTFEVDGTPGQPGTLDMCLSAQYNPPMLCSHIAVVAPAIKAIAEGPSQADICQYIDYHYTVTNTGTGTARNVVLHANLPHGLTTADGQQALAVNVGDLAQGQSKTVNARLRATQPGRFTTEAMVTSDAGEVRTEQVATNILAPRLAVTITGPKEAFPGQPLDYQVTVSNHGDAPADATRVRLGSTPGHVQFVSATGAEGARLASEREGGGQDLGSLAPGESRTFNVRFNVLQTGPIAVNATAAAKCAADVTSYVNTNVATVTASTLVVTHDPDPVPVGSNVTYHMVLENKGNAPDHDVRVSATLPEALQFVSGDGDTKVSNDGRNLTFGPVDTLQPRQRVTWTITAKALQPALAQLEANMVSQATPQAAAKVEPTKIYGVQGGTETRTREAPAIPGANEHAPAPAPNDQQQLNK